MIPFQNENELEMFSNRIHKELTRSTEVDQIAIEVSIGTADYPSGA